MCLFLKVHFFLIIESTPIPLFLFVHRRISHNTLLFPSVLIVDIIHSTLHSNALLFKTTKWFKTIKTSSSLRHNGLRPLVVQQTHSTICTEWALTQPHLPAWNNNPILLLYNWTRDWK